MWIKHPGIFFTEKMPGLFLLVLRIIVCSVGQAGLRPAGDAVIAGELCGKLLVYINAQPGLVVCIDKAGFILRAAGENLAKGVIYARPFLYAEVVGDKVKMYVCCMPYGRHVAGPWNAVLIPNARRVSTACALMLRRLSRLCALE